MILFFLIKFTFYIDNILVLGLTKYNEFYNNYDTFVWHS